MINLLMLLLMMGVCGGQLYYIQRLWRVQGMYGRWEIRLSLTQCEVLTIATMVYIVLLVSVFIIRHVEVVS